MTKEKIAVALYEMKRRGFEQIEILGELFSTDELLTMFYGRRILPSEGQDFITK